MLVELFDEMLLGREYNDGEVIWIVFLLSSCSTPSAHHCFSPLPSNKYTVVPNTYTSAAIIKTSVHSCR